MVICHAAKTHWVQWVLKMRFFKVGSSQKLIIGCAKEYFKGNGNGNIFCKKKVEHTAVLISWFISQPLLWCAPTYANIFFFSGVTAGFTIKKMLFKQRKLWQSRLHFSPDFRTSNKKFLILQYKVWMTWKGYEKFQTFQATCILHAWKLIWLSTIYSNLRAESSPILVAVHFNLYEVQMHF